MVHEHLAVAVTTGADADRGHGHRVGDHAGDRVGHALEHDREARRPRPARPRRRRSRAPRRGSCPAPGNRRARAPTAGVRPRWPITGISASRIACTASSALATAFELHRARAGAHERGRVARRSPRATRGSSSTAGRRRRARAACVRATAPVWCAMSSMVTCSVSS